MHRLIGFFAVCLSSSFCRKCAKFWCQNAKSNFIFDVRIKGYFKCLCYFLFQPSGRNGTKISLLNHNFPTLLSIILLFSEINQSDAVNDSRWILRQDAFNLMAAQSQHTSISSNLIKLHSLQWKLTSLACVTSGFFFVITVCASANEFLFPAPNSANGWSGFSVNKTLNLQIQNTLSSWNLLPGWTRQS